MLMWVNLIFVVVVIVAAAIGILYFFNDVEM